jgi:hypothetical protein
MNRIEDTFSVPSMSDRASVARTQVAKIGKTNIDQMEVQLDQWGSHLDALAARVGALGAAGGAERQVELDTLKVKRELARTKFEEFRNAGSAQWELFSSDLERAWIDFETGLEQLANRLSS